MESTTRRVAFFSGQVKCSNVSLERGLTQPAPGVYKLAMEKTRPERISAIFTTVSSFLAECDLRENPELTEALREVLRLIGEPSEESIAEVRTCLKRLISARRGDILRETKLNALEVTLAAAALVEEGFAKHGNPWLSLTEMPASAAPSSDLEAEILKACPYGKAVPKSAIAAAVRRETDGMFGKHQVYRALLSMESQGKITVAQRGKYTYYSAAKQAPTAVDAESVIGDLQKVLKQRGLKVDLASNG